MRLGEPVSKGAEGPREYSETVWYKIEPSK